MNTIKKACGSQESVSPGELGEFSMDEPMNTIKKACGSQESVSPGEPAYANPEVLEGSLLLKAQGRWRSIGAHRHIHNPEIIFSIEVIDGRALLRNLLNNTKMLPTAPYIL